MIKRSQPWTLEDDERLRNLAEEGRTARTISERLKRTPEAVRRRAKSLKIILVEGIMTGMPWTPVEDHRLRNAALSGLSCPEIALEMRRSASSVRARVGHLQIKVARSENCMTSAAVSERLNRPFKPLRPSERMLASRYTVSADEMASKAKK
jgi:hypothetical protein